MASALTINIGVTGHRDIPEQDHDALAKALKEELLATQKKYPNTTINILSGLAEGADQLMVKVAFELELAVIAILPFEISEYEKDFTTSDSQQTFRKLLTQCTDVQVCPLILHLPREQGYRELGKKLVGCSDILIALWDGVINEGKLIDGTQTLPGGTADVVKMCVEGLVDESSLLFSKPNKTYCKWLVCNRTRHGSLPASIQSYAHIGTWQSLPISGQQDEKLQNDILSKTERFNTEALSISDKQKADSAAYLYGKNPPQDGVKSIQKIVDVYCVADCLAQIRQKQRFQSLKLITCLSFIAIFAQQIYAGLFPTISWFLAHVFLVGLVIFIYWKYFVGSDSKEEEFVEWRVFAEDLRVQIFWHLAGIAEHSANNYRTTKLYEMDWIVDNLNKLMLHIAAPSSHHIQFVREAWIQDQRNYFYGQRGERGRAAECLLIAKRYQIKSIVLFVSAILLMCLSVIKIHLNLWPAFSSEVLFIVIAMAFISSALLKTFSSQMGFDELSQRYLRTGYFFQQAMNRMALLDKDKPDDIQTYQQVIKTIGIEALNENAAWLQLHKMNAYQIQVT
ncbi:hypothetical protein [uncultured Paraglaciecola sp.]|uniref:hypothetical protein n=1 Tax=uncultured Paraglaciecola sp. TaxID=1765024 RepID=UPI002624E9E5|nr:hypothetical protein [uncultured Paraglaciecola sp.]